MVALHLLISIILTVELLICNEDFRKGKNQLDTITRLICFVLASHNVSQPNQSGEIELSCNKLLTIRCVSVQLRNRILFDNHTQIEIITSNSTHKRAFLELAILKWSFDIVQYSDLSESIPLNLSKTITAKA